MLDWLRRVLPAGGTNDAATTADQAKAALARQDYAGAQTLYRKALENDPTDAACHLGLAGALLGQSRVEDALQAARQALESAPGNADAAYWLASNLQGLARYTEAAAVLDASLAHNPDHAELLGQRADVHHAMGEFDAAARRYEAALAQQPNQPNQPRILTGFGSLKLDRHDAQGAVELLERAVDLDPYSAAALHYLGKALQAAGRMGDALPCYEQALAIRPAGPIHRDFAIALREAGALPQAVEHFRAALSTMPADRAHVDLQSRLGEALLATGDLAGAIACCRTVLDAEPAHLDALVNLGGALQGERRFAEADDAYRRALALAPGLAAIHFNLGTLAQSEGYFSRGDARRAHFAAAKAAYEAALAREPGHLDALLCLASLAMADLRLDEAHGWLDRAVTLAPDNPDARTRSGQLALLMGDFADGWRDYEYRFGQTGNKRLPPFAQPLWRNDFPLAGKTILLLAEQGMGDAIHFVRYVELVARQAPAAILIEAHEALRPLLQTLPVPTTMLEPGKPYPTFDCFCPLMSLPYAFGTRADSIPARIPYLAPEPQRAAAWAERLREETLPRIGIVWSGSTALNNDFHRSIALREFATLLPPGRRVFSLQKELREADAEALAGLPDIVRFDEHLHDYGDTAALIANLDLVISVDTSVAHLAGALGKPVWILLPFLPDYRWQTARTDSPWYPTARLFRQREAGDWTPVFAQVRQALDNLAS